MARSLWTGTITFGLVNIPIKLYTAVRDRSIHFHMLNPEGDCRLRRKLYCPETEKEYDFSEAAKGYELAPGQYVLVDREEVQRLKPETGDSLAIQQVIQQEEIDPIYFQKPYFLGPAKGGQRAYNLLLQTLQEAGKVAIGQFVMRSKQHFVVLRPFEGALMIHTLNYDEEIVSLDEVPGVEDKAKVSDEEKQMARQLLDSMTSEFNPEKYHDEYTEQVQELVEKAREGGEVQASEDTGRKETGKVLNLMDALRGSLEKEKSGAGKAGGKKKETRKSKGKTTAKGSSKSAKGKSGDGSGEGRRKTG